VSSSYSEDRKNLTPGRKGAKAQGRIFKGENILQVFAQKPGKSHGPTIPGEKTLGEYVLSFSLAES